MHAAAGTGAASYWSVRKQGVITIQMFLIKGQTDTCAKWRPVFCPSTCLCECVPFCCTGCLTSLFIYLVNDSHIFLHYSFILLYLLSLTCPSLTPSLFPSPSFSSPLFCVWINDMKSQRLRLSLYPPYTRSPHLHTHTTLTQIMSIHAQSQSASSAMPDHSPHIRRAAKCHLNTKVAFVPFEATKPEDTKVALKWRDIV